MSEVNHTDAWRYEIKYGPEGEDNYAWMYDDTGKMVATLQTYQAAKIVRNMNAASEMLEALDKASQLASVASDWNLYEVEINDKMVSILDIKDEFDHAIAKASGEAQ